MVFRQTYIALMRIKKISNFCSISVIWNSFLDGVYRKIKTTLNRGNLACFLASKESSLVTTTLWDLKKLVECIFCFLHDKPLVGQASHGILRFPDLETELSGPNSCRSSGHQAWKLDKDSCEDLEIVLYDSSVCVCGIVDFLRFFFFRIFFYVWWGINF